jgi:hypothetical protein
MQIRYSPDQSDTIVEVFSQLSRLIRRCCKGLVSPQPSPGTVTIITIVAVHFGGKTGGVWRAKKDCEVSLRSKSRTCAVGCRQLVLAHYAFADVLAVSEAHVSDVRGKERQVVARFGIVGIRELRATEVFLCQRP